MKKLRQKIVFAVFVSVLVVFMLTVLSVGAAIKFSTISRSDNITEFIADNGGKLPIKKNYDKLSESEKIRLYEFDEETPYRLRYFVVNYSSGKVESVNVEHIAAVDESTAEEFAETVLMSGNKTGDCYDYRYRVSDDNTCVVFLDISDEIESSNYLVIIMCLVALMFVAVITVIFYFLSKRVVRPFEENSRMQKQFITDASHELKTPLAIISANAEVLAYKDGENEWINNITTQVGRIGELINELLTLNRLEEIEDNIDIEEVNLSEIITKASDDFVEVFKSKNVTLTREVKENVTLNGNFSQLERLVSVLVENASKYVSESGEVKITLKQDSKHTKFSVFNSCEIDKNVDYSHLFDRFYRPDASRTSKTGGHGIGLSIAKRIAMLHNGKIEAVPSGEGLSFNVVLSSKLRAGKKQNKS